MYSWLYGEGFIVSFEKYRVDILTLIASGSFAVYVIVHVQRTRADKFSAKV